MGILESGRAGGRSGWSWCAPVTVLLALLPLNSAQNGQDCEANPQLRGREIVLDTVVEPLGARGCRGRRVGATA